MEQFIQLTIFLIVIILLARLAPLFGRRFGLPAITVQLLIGIFLGPSLFNLLETPLVIGTWGSIPPTLLHSILKILVEIGLIQLMFLAGLKTDWQKLKTDLKPIFFMSGWGFVLTAVGITIVMQWFADRLTEALAVSAVMAGVSFGISAFIFHEMKVLESRSANIVLGSSVVNGLLAILLMIASQATDYALIYGTFKMTVAVSWLLGKLIMFFAISYFLMSRFLKRIEKTGFEKWPRQTLIGYLLLVAALYAWGAMHFGSFAGVGVASLGGALLGMSSLVLKEKIAGGFGSGLASLPIGILFVVLGMEANFGEVWLKPIFLVVLFGTVVGAKSLGYWIATKRFFDSVNQKPLIHFGCLNQGEVGMLIAAYLFSRGLVNPYTFNTAITVVVILMMLSAVLMKITSYSPSLFGGRGH